MTLNVALNDLVTHNVRVMLTFNGMTIKALADRLDRPVASLAQRLSGRRRWQLDELPAVAAALGLTAKDLIDARLIPSMPAPLPGSQP